MRGIAMTRSARFFIASLIAGISLSANAVVISTDRDNFIAAAGSTDLTFENFDSFGEGMAPTVAGVSSITASLGTVLATNQFLTTTSPNGIGSTSPGGGFIFFLADETVTFTFASAITAFAIDINSFGDLDGDYTATLSTGDVVDSVFDVFSGQVTGQFVGLVSDTAFTSVTIAANGSSPSPNLTYTLDGLFFGSGDALGGATPVPTPPMLALLSLGMIGLAAARRRRSA